MSRPLRIEYEGAFYHVMNRGLNRNTIFHDAEYDRYLFKKTLAEAVQYWKIRIHAYSLMENHYHLLIETPLANISRAMRHIDGVYTQRFNRHHEHDGPLLRGRFKSILVEKESYFLELVRYIHLNGVKAKAFPSPLNDFHSSHWDFLHPHQAEPWLEQSLVLSYFERKNISPQEALHRYVLEGIPKGLEEILSRKKWPTILGVKSFIESVRSTSLKSQKKNRDLPQKNQILRMVSLQPDVIMKTIEKIYDSEQEDDKSKNANKIWYREKRWATIYFLRRYSMRSFGDIGDLMGGLSYKSVQKYLYRNDHSKSPRVSKLETDFSMKMSHVAT